MYYTESQHHSLSIDKEAWPLGLCLCFYIRTDECIIIWIFDTVHLHMEYTMTMTGDVYVQTSFWDLPSNAC